MEQGKERGAPNASIEMQTEHEAERDLQHAALLLLDIAGDAPEHIVMNTSPRTEKKYLTVHRPLTLADMQNHLEGRKTLGATLQHQDGTTRALCFDADDLQTWQSLQDATIALEDLGYKPLLEPSPAQRGGHLWLIFSERVNADAARSQVVTIAPALRKVGEYWPSRGNQKVRLPAGKYVTPTFSQWIHLVDADSRDRAGTGAGAPNTLNVFLSNLTPAELIPDAAPADEQEQTETAQPARGAKRQLQSVTTQEPDEQHRQKYGVHAMWVEWPDEQYLIDRFNAAHTIADLAIFERNGMINASQIGRPERTASIGVTRDGERFTDFGAVARQPDGTQDGGDPFEFYIRSRRLEKAEALRELGRDLNRQASRELLRAARAGELLAAWVMDIITPAGRAIYNENADRHGHPPLEARSGGLVGFSTPEQEQLQVQQVKPEAVQMDAELSTLSETDELWQREQPAQQIIQEYEGDHPPPQRPCICCNITAWKWTGEKYICSGSGRPLG